MGAPLSLCMVLLVIAARAEAQDSLPYSVRTQPYNAFNTFAGGDTRTVGMAGATVGLADTFLAATNNPAGLGLTLNALDTNLTNNDIHDAHVQNYSEPIGTPTALGIAFNHYPWGVSLGMIPVGREGQLYTLPPTASPGLPGKAAELLTESHEFRMAGGMVLFDDRLSLGGSLNVGRGEEEIIVPQTGLDDDRHAATVGATLGALYKFRERLLIGLSYTTPMHYSIGGAATGLPGFFQNLDTPQRLELGAGWIPNRSFRGAVQLSWIGTTPGAALLSDNAVSVGSAGTLQPKIGLAYVFADFRDFQGTTFLGEYYESTRIAGTSNRFHETFGIELKPWFVTLGGGFDEAPGFENILYSVGVDAGYVLERLHLVPDFGRHLYQGTFPNPVRRSDDDLARPLRQQWPPPASEKKPELNPITAIEQIPERVKKEKERLQKELGD